MLKECASARLLLFCATLLALGCGCSSNVRVDAGEGGEGGDSVEVEEGGGEGGAAGSDGAEPVTELPLEPGTCGVARIVALPREPLLTHGPLTRQNGGFALGPWKVDEGARLQAYYVDEQGREPRLFEASGSTNDASWPSLLSAADLAVEVFVPPRVAAGDDVFRSRTFGNGDSDSLARGDVLHAQWRGTDEVVLSPTLDGQRAVLAIWPHALSEPRAAVIGPDGALVGEPHSFATPDYANRCAAVTPTEHGAFVSFVDSAERWRLFELSADGEVTLEVSWPWPALGFGCPLFALQDAGLAFLLDRAAQDAAPDVGLYRVDRSGTVTETSLPEPVSARALGWLGDEPLVLVSRGESYELARPLRGDSFPLPLPAGIPTRVASEAGSLFIDVTAEDGGRTMVKLACR